MSQCEVCSKREAVTRDNRLCRRCLHNRILSMENFAHPVIREELDRPQRNLKALGGTAEFPAKRDDE